MFSKFSFSLLQTNLEDRKLMSQEIRHVNNTSTASGTRSMLVLYVGEEISMYDCYTDYKPNLQWKKGGRRA